MYRCGIIGVGKIGSTFDDVPLKPGVYTHASAYENVQETQLVAGADSNPEALQAFGKRRKVRSLYTDYKVMLRKEQLDIVSICTPIESHYEIITEVVEAGVKGIFCEKPMTDTLEKADEIVKLVQKSGVVFAVNHMRRWDSGIQKIKQYIDKGELGEIQKVVCYYTKGIFNNGSHVIDLLRFIVGEMDSVRAVNSLSDDNLNDPALDVYLTFEKGFTGSLIGLDAQYFSLFECFIVGTSGRIKIRNSGYTLELDVIKGSTRYAGYKELRPTRSPFRSTLSGAIASAVRDIIRCIRTGEKPKCSAVDAQESLMVILSAIDSARQDEKEIKIHV
jgi:predicted dehydrogenase